MQGDPKVLDTLNQLLAGELAARDQYFIHAAMYQDWGLNRLYERFHHEMEEETEHARAIINRILMLGGTPRMTPEALNIGQDVADMLKKDLAVELHVRDALKSAMALCEQQRDYVSRDMLLTQLADTEEDHAYWIEKQLGLIDKIGLPNYLQSQMG
ncbi:bacterioferritin [Ottowia testudinis]|uniref:Bacterioferritin n=1 Tax=Ottowia testudinis TaxID=2816950 RepID=A0A975H410_9BURK|nr:bacterioferritin [Ottowia testudinis]QTD46369.1 bacterioferritin [Ottowia testudinis]